MSYMYELTAPKVDPEARVYAKEPTWQVYEWARDFKQEFDEGKVYYGVTTDSKLKNLAVIQRSVDALSPEGKQALDAITNAIKTKTPNQYMQSLPGLLDAFLATDPTNPKSPAIVFEWARRFLEELKKIKADIAAGTTKGHEVRERILVFTAYKWNDPATPLMRASKLLPPDAKEALDEARRPAGPDKHIEAVTRFLEFERAPGGAGPAAAGAGGPAGGKRRKTRKGKGKGRSRRNRYSRRR